jgi:hypothetical protein
MLPAVAGLTSLGALIMMEGTLRRRPPAFLHAALCLVVVVSLALASRPPEASRPTLGVIIGLLMLAALLAALVFPPRPRRP